MFVMSVVHVVVAAVEAVVAVAVVQGNSQSDERMLRLLSVGLS